MSGKADQGERASVTAGKNMDGFLALAKDIVRLNGLEEAEICLQRRMLTLPGYFRPTKLWDMLVINDGKLVAALEFKSQVGPIPSGTTSTTARKRLSEPRLTCGQPTAKGAFGTGTPARS